MPDQRLPGLAMAMFSILTIGVSCYFSYAAIQGEFGLFRRMQLESQEELLRRELSALVAERRIMENRTRRLSAEYLDLDLLDEQARKVLGLARGDEIVIH